MSYYKNGFLMRRWGQCCALCVNCGKRIREGEKYSRSYDRGLWSYRHVRPCPTKEEPSMKEHYYLIIDDKGVSVITKAASPEQAVNQAVAPSIPSALFTSGCKWRTSKGRADHHYLGYQFRWNGALVSPRMIHVVDLGPTTAYDAPGLPAERMTNDCGRLHDCDNCERLEEAEDLLTICERKDEPTTPFDPCAHCPPLEGYENLIEHHEKHHGPGGLRGEKIC